MRLSRRASRTIDRKNQENSIKEFIKKYCRDGIILATLSFGYPGEVEGTQVGLIDIKYTSFTWDW